MSANRALPRLLQVRQLEEDHLKAVLESALGNLECLIEAERAALQRERTGRLLLVEAIHSGKLQDRLAGSVEMSLAKRARSALSLKIEEAREVVRQVRAQCIAKRAERRQLETLIEKERAGEARQASQRQQEALDDRFRSRRFRVRRAEKPLTPSLDRTHAGAKPEASGE